MDGRTKGNPMQWLSKAQERENTLAWEHKFIRHRDILTASPTEQAYLLTLYNAINKYDFNADTLKVTEQHFTAVLLAG